MRRHNIAIDNNDITGRRCVHLTFFDVSTSWNECISRTWAWSVTCRDMYQPSAVALIPVWHLPISPEANGWHRISQVTQPLFWNSSSCFDSYASCNTRWRNTQLSLACLYLNLKRRLQSVFHLSGIPTGIANCYNLRIQRPVPLHMQGCLSHLVDHE